MKRCLNCMEEYNETSDRCPQCHYREGEQKKQSWILNEGNILQKRYIVGTSRRIRECDVIYVGWDALFERKVLIQEFFPRQCVTRTEGINVTILDEKNELFCESLNRFVHYHKNLIRFYKEDDIICVYSCFQENGTAYATMQYSEAETLKQWLEYHGGVSERECMKLMYQATEALKKIHGLGLIHGDVDLESFWIGNSGNLVLKDFAEPCHYCGSPGMQDYQNVGSWIDVYGLAVLFGKLMLAQDLFDSDRVCGKLAGKNSGYPLRVLRAFKNAIAVGSEQRIKTLEEFSRQMFGDSVTMRLTVHSGSRQRRWKKQHRRSRGKSVLLFILLATIALTATVSLANNRNKEPVVDENSNYSNEATPSKTAPSKTTPSKTTPSKTAPSKATPSNAASGSTKLQKSH